MTARPGDAEFEIAANLAQRQAFGVAHMIVTPVHQGAAVTAPLSDEDGALVAAALHAQAEVYERLADRTSAELGDARPYRAKAARCRELATLLHRPAEDPE